MIENLEIVDSHFVLGTFRNIHINAWSSLVSQTRLQHLQKHQEKFYQSISSPTVTLTLLYHTKLHTHTKEDRAEIAHIRKEQMKYALCSHHFFYVPAGGIVAGTLRVILSAIQLISRDAAPYFVSTKSNEISRWLAKLSNSTPDEMITIIREFESHLSLQEIGLIPLHER